MKYDIFCLLFLCVFAACTEDIETGKGTLQIASLETQLSGVEVQPLTRAISPVLNVDICDETGSEIIVHIPAGEANGAIGLEAGNYLLKAFSDNWQASYGNNEKGEAKYYKEQPFTIEAGKVNRLSLSLPMLNCGVQLSLPEGFNGWLKEYTFSVTDNMARTVNITQGETAYFDCGTTASLTYTLTAVNYDDESNTLKGELEAGQGKLYNVAFTINLATGNACKYAKNYVEIEMEKVDK